MDNPCNHLVGYVLLPHFGRISCSSLFPRLFSATIALLMLSFDIGLVLGTVLSSRSKYLDFVARIEAALNPFRDLLGIVWGINGLVQLDLACFGTNRVWTSFPVALSAPCSPQI